MQTIRFPREAVRAASGRATREGVVVGLFGYASVALFYSTFDFLAARGTFYTVDLLGKAVFRGLRDPGILGLPIRYDPVAIFWYNGLHFVISLAIGFVVARLVAQAERRPALALPVLVTIVAGFVATVLAVGLLSTPIRPVLPWWSIVVANASATLLAGLYLLRRHPGLWVRFLSAR